MFRKEAALELAQTDRQAFMKLCDDFSLIPMMSFVFDFQTQKYTKENVITIQCMHYDQNPKIGISCGKRSKTIVFEAFGSYIKQQIVEHIKKKHAKSESSEVQEKKTTESEKQPADDDESLHIRENIQIVDNQIAGHLGM